LKIFGPAMRQARIQRHLSCSPAACGADIFDTAVGECPACAGLLLRLRKVGGGPLAEPEQTGGRGRWKRRSGWRKRALGQRRPLSPRLQLRPGQRRPLCPRLQLRPGQLSMPPRVVPQQQPSMQQLGWRRSQMLPLVPCCAP
jgi:hypothetical protein